MKNWKTESKRKQYRKKKQERILLFLLLVMVVAVGCFFGAERYRTWYEKREEQESDVTDPALQVHFMDVGQGDATLITCGEHAMLIDAGNNSMGTTVQLYLKKAGVERLDYVIATHPDADHIGGLDVIITKYDCGKIIMPAIERENATYQEVLAAMEYRGYERTLPVTGDTYPLGDASFTIASAEGNFGEEYNNYSIGILLTHGEKRFLFVGDAEEAAEEAMLKTGLDIRADVLKVGHHGSSDSTGEVFLEAVSPAYAVISCGKGNDYGHPHKSTLNVLKENGVWVYRTDEQGSIIAASDGQHISFDKEPSTSWKTGWDS